MKNLKKRQYGVRIRPDHELTYEEFLAECEKPENKIAEKDIPHGPYCYDENGKCPFWYLRHDKPARRNGYCFYLGSGDWEVDGVSLLWDKVKECSINE